MHTSITTPKSSITTKQPSSALFGVHTTPFFQPKLTVNQPNDPYEQEADAVADQVMRMRDGDTPVVQRMFAPSIQRACAHCEEKQKEQEGVQRKETGSGDAGGQTAPSVVSDVLSSGGGQPMDTNTQQFMGSRMGQDFSDVRIHTGSKAAESASAIQARAYTSGTDIVFGKGEYQPGSESGKRLLAHELVHVGQQGGGVNDSPIQRSVGGVLAGIGIGGVLGGVGGFLVGGVTGALIGAGIGALVGGLIGTFVGNKEKEDSGPKKNANGNFDALTGIYNAVAGDTLRGVADRLHTSVETIIKDNPGLTVDATLSAGQALFISDLILPSIPKGDTSTKWSFEDYIKKWETQKGRPISAIEKQHLARGCVGVSAINTGQDPLSNLNWCFDSFAGSIKKAKELNVVLKAAGEDSIKKVQIFSKRFYARPDKSYPTDSAGKVDMSAYSGEDRKPGMVNFDYGFFDQETGMWWHANHCDPREGGILCRNKYSLSERMYVYESTLEHYSRPLKDFDQQVFCVVVQNI
jgi:LysM repeat protein